VEGTSHEGVEPSRYPDPLRVAAKEGQMHSLRGPAHHSIGGAIGCADEGHNPPPKGAGRRQPFTPAAMQPLTGWASPPCGWGGWLVAPEPKRPPAVCHVL
jgi:hypothetical protein